MIQLAQSAFPRLRPFFDALDYNLLVDSVIAGNTPGMLYAEDPLQPQLALLWNRQDGLILAGLPGSQDQPALHNSLKDLLGRIILPDARQRYIPQLCLLWHPPEWEARLPQLLADWRPEKAYRRLYLLKQIGFNYRHHLQPGHSVERISQALLQSDLLNREQVLGWIESFWPSLKFFLERGFGFCVVNRYAITSWCLSIFTYGKRFELGVATGENYRRQGHASLAAAACLEHCLLNNLIPEWHCWEDNLPSVKVAEKIGFEQRLSYPAYRFHTGLVYNT